MFIFGQMPAMLILYSAILIQIAVIQVIDFSNNQASKLSEPAGVIALLCSVFQVVPGVASFVTGLAAMLYNSHRTATTMVTILLNIVALFYAGPFDFFQLYYQGSLWDALSISLMSLLFRLALPGGILVFMAQLMYLQPGNNLVFKGFLFRAVSSLSKNAIFWNSILLLAGLGTIMKGFLFHNNEGSIARIHWLGTANLSFMMVVTGLMMAACAIWGITIVARRDREGPLYSTYTTVVIAVAVLNLSVVHLGIVERSSSGSVIVNVGQVLTTVALGPYFTHALMTQGAGESSPGLPRYRDD